ncbi:MAG: GNAT family N-acetyltransferase, partial [Myxococcaceae bacterium]
GEAGLGLLTETAEVEAGYILRKDYWGRGYGTELLQGLLVHGFSNLGLSRIVAVCNPENLASARIMEKCGMTFIGKVLNEDLWVSKYAVDSRV